MALSIAVRAGRCAKATVGAVSKFRIATLPAVAPVVVPHGVRWHSPTPSETYGALVSCCFIDTFPRSPCLQSQRMQHREWYGEC